MEFELRQKVMKDIRKYVGQRAGADNRYKRHSSAVENELKKSRVGFVHFVDISKLTNKQNRGLPCAILIGIAINPKFVKDVFNNPDYKPVLEDEYVKTENRVG